MLREFKIDGMSCQGCAAKVRSVLISIPDVVSAEVDKATDSATLEMGSAIPIQFLDKKLKEKDQKYSISRLSEPNSTSIESWFERYRPILIIFFYILIVSLTIQFVSGAFDIMMWMRHFMAGFFLVFSFFKMLDLSGFAKNYSSYDIIAKIWKPWGYIYAFIELGLGMAYLVGVDLLTTNIIAFGIMSISLIGVLRSVLNKEKIQCACLGTVFDLPMSTVTIIEDALMIFMSGFMIFNLL